MKKADRTKGGLTASNFTIVTCHAPSGPITILPAEKLNITSGAKSVAVLQLISTAGYTLTKDKHFTPHFKKFQTFPLTPG